MKTDSVTYSGVSQSNAAIVAAVGLLVMAIPAPIANFGILHKLVVAGDATATVSNIFGSSGLFRIAICFLVIVAILDVMVAWSLYVVLKPVNKSLSLLAAWFRLAYAAIFAFAVASLLNILSLQQNDMGQVLGQVMLLLASFQGGWDIALAIFGLHLFLVGYLVLRSGYFPKFLGVLLLIASLGYLVDSFGKILVPDYGISISSFTFIGEVLLIVWLFMRGFGKKDNLAP